MPKPRIDADSERLLPVLWQLFLNKLEREWRSKYSHLGTSLSSLESQQLLSQYVLEDMKASLGGALTALSGKDIDQYFRLDGWPPSVSTAQLTYFLSYLGYTDWCEFRKQCSEEDQRHTPSTGNTKKKAKGFPNDNLPYFGPIILLLCYPFFLVL